MSLPSAADLSRSLDGAGGVVFAVGTLLAGEGSAFTTRGSRLRLRMKKRKPTFFADTRKSRGKTFWSGDRPCSVGILSTDEASWWRTGRPRLTRPGQGELQGVERCKAPPAGMCDQGAREKHECRNPSASLNERIAHLKQ